VGLCIVSIGTERFRFAFFSLTTKHHPDDTKTTCVVLPNTDTSRGAFLSLRQTDRPTERQTHRTTERQNDRTTERQTHRLTERQTDRTTDSQNDRQTNKNPSGLAFVLTFLGFSLIVSGSGLVPFREKISFVDVG
jgi:hypothetical protein